MECDESQVRVTCREANGLPLMRGVPGGVEGRCEPTTGIPYKDRARELCRVLGRRLGCPMPFMPETQWVHEDFVQLPEGDCIWCICSQAINSYHIVQNVESGVRFKVGTACIKRYSTETLQNAARTALALHRRASCQAEGCTAKIDRRTKLGRIRAPFSSNRQATWRPGAAAPDARTSWTRRTTRTGRRTASGATATCRSRRICTYPSARKTRPRRRVRGGCRSAGSGWCPPRWQTMHASSCWRAGGEHFQCRRALHS